MSVSVIIGILTAIIAILGILTTILIAWQVYNAIELNKLRKELEGRVNAEVEDYAHVTESYVLFIYHLNDKIRGVCEDAIDGFCLAIFEASNSKRGKRAAEFALAALRDLIADNKGQRIDVYNKTIQSNINHLKSAQERFGLDVEDVIDAIKDGHKIY